MSSHPHSYKTNDRIVTSDDVLPKYSRILGNDKEVHLLIFEQYKEASRLASNAVDRRYSLNSIFVSILTTGALAIVTAYRFLAATLGQTPILLAALIGVVICVAWYFWISFLMAQSHARQQVLEELERYLPASIYRSTNARLKLADHNLIAKTEKMIPLLLGLIFGAVLLLSGFNRTHI